MLFFIFGYFSPEKSFATYTVSPGKYGDCSYVQTPDKNKIEFKPHKMMSFYVAPVWTLINRGVDKTHVFVSLTANPHYFDELLRIIDRFNVKRHVDQERRILTLSNSLQTLGQLFQTIHSEFEPIGCLYLVLARLTTAFENLKKWQSNPPEWLTKQFVSPGFTPFTEKFSDPDNFKEFYFNEGPTFKNPDYTDFFFKEPFGEGAEFKKKRSNRQTFFFRDEEGREVASTFEYGET